VRGEHGGQVGGPGQAAGVRRADGRHVREHRSWAGGLLRSRAMELEGLGRLGIFSGDLAGQPASGQRRVVAEPQEVGYGGLWYGEASARETFVQGAIFLSATQRMLVASGIANIYARDPTAMAFGGRSLNELGGGRFVLGLGVAHASNVTARGHEYGR